MTIQWGLLKQYDVGGAFKAAYDEGLARRREEQTAAALAAYADNPSDPQAQGALARLSPQFAMSVAQQKLAAQGDEAKRARIGQYVVDGDFTGGAKRAAMAGDVDIAEQLMKLDKPQREQISGMYKAAAPIAYQAMKMPYEQRRAYIATVAPQLKAAGWTDEQLASFDPTDDALKGVVDSQMTLEQAFGRDEVKWHQVGDRPSFATDAQGRPIGSGNPYATGGGSPPVLTDEDIMRLEGGPTDSPSGNFPR